jgi:hypothetical protein
VNSIENIPPHGSFDVQSGVNREQFLELLYQVYRTNRPVWADLKTLCDAVNKLGGPILLWKLRQFFVDDSQVYSLVMNLKIPIPFLLHL